MVSAEDTIRRLFPSTLGRVLRVSDTPARPTASATSANAWRTDHPLAAPAGERPASETKAKPVSVTTPPMRTTRSAVTRRVQSRRATTRAATKRLGHGDLATARSVARSLAGPAAEGTTGGASGGAGVTEDGWVQGAQARNRTPTGHAQTAAVRWRPRTALSPHRRPTQNDGQVVFSCAGKRPGPPPVPSTSQAFAVGSPLRVGPTLMPTTPHR